MRCLRAPSAMGALLSLAFTLVLIPAAGVAQPSLQIEREVRQALAGEREFREVEVSVAGSEATLRGRVPTMWVKAQAIESALGVEGVETVASELEIPRVETDEELAREVTERILTYRHYTMMDLVQGRVLDGVVTLTGSVTPDHDKAGDLFERIVKIRGVQDMEMRLHRQSVSRRDTDIRRTIASRVRGNEVLSRYNVQAQPPFHILVDNRTVRLVGFVASEVERRLLERIASQALDTVEVINDLQIG